MNYILIFISLFTFGVSQAQTPAPIQPVNSTSNNSKIEKLEQRILDLEQQQIEFNRWYSEFYIQSKGRVTPFLGERLSIGGFFETGITHQYGTDMDSQTAVNSNALGINFAADFNENLRFVSQYLTVLSYPLQNPHNNPGLTPTKRENGAPVIGSLVAHAYLEYRWKESLLLQTGLGYVPFGFAFQEREPVLFIRRGGPLLLNAADTTYIGIAFPLWMGLNLQGSFDLSAGKIGYSLYTFSPTNSKNLGVGGRLSWTNSDNITFGTSVQSAEQKTHSFYSYGADVNVKYQRFGFTTEYARSVNSGGRPSVVSYYLEPYYNFENEEWLVYAVADYLENANHAVGAVTNSYEKLATGGGVNWLPTPTTRFRLGLLSHNYLNQTDTVAGQGRDYKSLDFSTAIAF